jgi:Putative Actinobacterial Holin-X, holin superfamily III
MVRSVRPDGADGQQSLGDLVATATRDISQLVHFEIALAKSELKMDARRIGIAAALAVIGLFVGCLVLVLLCFAFAYGLIAAGIWAWAAFLIVAGTCVVVIGIAGLIAYGRIRKVSGMKMTRKTVTADIDMLKQAVPSQNGSSQNGSKVSSADVNPKVGAGADGKPEIPAR